ncbi:hypothetical protein [Arcobacter porcinus]|uniref:Uncharacterized protein n=1 Tax=Arcobacter porcinus TaxID=1935204 RepID=A0A1C0AVM9_9BACT|nr:hypothetical protein [Arcobacter porcinus]OCL88857.1 hypothetical protein AAX27_01986 [Aliarcobacter thereius]OCL81755.1 hypothetical protein AAW29_01728 [Arcobacter porcinus]OCL82244.1 hypothetical protein AAW30_01529 [Arcobacter porcinus]OCL88275.1 hypothetical protein AAX30_00891 [Arcobacter porcinus]OCL90745.1 hypothetical protein AAX28_01562 [Arcobacter porcinus]
MISFSRKKVKKITKVSLIVLIFYSFIFLSYSAYEYYQSMQEKNELLKELDIRKIQTDQIKDKIKDIDNKKVELKARFLNKEELDKKLKSVFKNYSLADYTLSLVDSKMLCVDRFMLIVNLDASSKEGIQAGERILGYLGKVQRKKGFDTLYFVDYIQKAR